MKDDKDINTVYGVTSKILYILVNDLSSSFSKANLANLRASVGKDIYKSLDTFALVFSNLPEDFLGRTGDLTKEEEAIITSLQLFALHQQGNQNSMNSNEKHINIGNSLSNLRVGGDSQAIDRRFNAMITSNSFVELNNHLRHLVKILKSKTNELVNYSRLAEDLYWIQRGYDKDVKLKWARSFYRRRFDKKEGEL